MDADMKDHDCSVLWEDDMTQKKYYLRGPCLAFVFVQRHYRTQPDGVVMSHQQHKHYVYVEPPLVGLFKQNGFTVAPAHVVQTCYA